MMITGGLEWLGINPYQAVVWSGIVFATAMLFMAGSCHAFRYLFQSGTKGCCCKRTEAVERMRSGQRVLNHLHPMFVWGTVFLGVVHIGLAITVVGLPTSLAQTTLILGWILFAAFICWLGTCYYFRHLVEKHVFRKPPFCGATAVQESGYSGERWIYRYHRTFLYIVLLLLPIHASLPLTGLPWIPVSPGLMPGIIVSGLILVGILWWNLRLDHNRSGCCNT